MSYISEYRKNDPECIDCRSEPQRGAGEFLCPRVHQARQASAALGSGRCSFGCRARRRLGRLVANFVSVEPWQRKANLALLQFVRRERPDLILVVATGGVQPGTLAQVRVLLPGVPIYCLYPDSPHNLDGGRINCLPVFDRVTASSPAWVPAFQRLGARQVCYLPFAADTELHYPLEQSGSLATPVRDLAFIGTWRAEREEFLEQLADLNLVIWGNRYWRTHTRPNSPLRKLWGGREAVGAAFVDACARSRILLNILDPITWPGPNMRTFELPACQAFALVERTDPVLELFTEGETVECFSSVQEARDKIEYYSRNEAARRRVAVAAHHLVLQAGHTYRDRVQQLLKWAAEDRR